MQEVFEKIIEKLEEKHEQYINQYGVVGGNPMAFAVKECKEIVKQFADEYEVVKKTLTTGDWIPCSEPPKDDRYVLLSFDNFSVPMVGRYEEDEKGGSYYIGDEMEPCVTQDIFVNAWQPLPLPFTDKE